MKQVLCLLLIILNFPSQGQTISQAYVFGNQEFEAGRFVSAIEVYQRVLFFDSTQTYSPSIYARIAHSLYTEKRYAEAANYYDLAYFSTDVDSLKTAYSLQKIASLLFLKQYSFAEVELLDMDTPLQIPSQEKERLFYEGLTAYAQGQFSTAEVAFKGLVSDTTTVHQLFRKNDRISKINPKKAKVLSMILPGLGQLYVGDVKNGLNSMLLTGGLFYLGLRSALNTTFIEGTLSFLPWVQRYYQGGFQKAERIAQEKIQEKRYELLGEILETID